MSPIRLIRRVRPRLTRMPRRRSVGQSIVEFAVILPVLLALVGMMIDFARIYQAQVNLESTTRSAAESLATSDKTDPTTSSNAGTRAKAILDPQYGANFTVTSTLGPCSTPTLTATYGESTSDPGASRSNPLATATVAACVPFRTLFAYPFLTTNGQWTVSSSKTYTIILWRGQ